MVGGWDAVRARAGAEWNGVVDRRTGLLEFAEGGGIAWIPGRGNRLSMADLGAAVKAGGAVDLGTLESIARGFLPGWRL